MSRLDQTSFEEFSCSLSIFLVPWSFYEKNDIFDLFFYFPQLEMFIELTFIQMWGAVVWWVYSIRKPHGAKGRRFEPQSFSFFFSQKNVRLTKVKPTRGEREASAAQEWREEEERLAGESRMVTKIGLVRFEDN